VSTIRLRPEIVLDPDEVRRYYQTHTISQTQKHFQVGYLRLSAFMKEHEIAVRRVGRSLPARTLVSLDEDEVRRYYQTHTMQETARQFRVGIARLSAFMKEHGIAVHRVGRRRW
jgi:phage antirepressor YoqD-like protein